MPAVDPYEGQDEDWLTIYQAGSAIAARYGVEDYRGRADYLIVDDNYGVCRHTIELHRLMMLQTSLILELQQVLNGYPLWEIVMAIDVPGKESQWRPMGVTIRQNEIIDGLKHELLPEPYRSLVIPGSAPGTDYD